MNTLGLKHAAQQFNSDEQGIEAIQAVIILAIAAVALQTILAGWETISQWASDVITELLR